MRALDWAERRKSLVASSSSDVETDFVGHADYAESRSIVADIFQLIHDRKRPGARSSLKAAEGAAGKYWRFVRGP